MKKTGKKTGWLRLAGLAAAVAALSVIVGVLDRLVFRKKRRGKRPDAE